MANKHRIYLKPIGYAVHCQNKDEGKTPYGVHPKPVYCPHCGRKLDCNDFK